MFLEGHTFGVAHMWHVWETLSKYYKHHPAVKNGEHGPTPCSRIIQRNRRNALCFKGFVILFKSVAIIDTWLTQDQSQRLCLYQLIDTLVKFECLFYDPHRCHCSLTVLYCTFAKCFHLKIKYSQTESDKICVQLFL